MGEDGQEELGPSVGTVTNHRRERDAIEGLSHGALEGGAMAARVLLEAGWISFLTGLMSMRRALHYLVWCSVHGPEAIGVK